MAEPEQSPAPSAPRARPAPSIADDRDRPRWPDAVHFGMLWRVALLAAAALALALGLLEMVRLLARPLAFLLAAVVIASALAPVVSWFARWMPRGVAILLVYFALLLIVVGIGWILIPPTVAQGRSLVENAPRLLEVGRTYLDRWDPIPVTEDQIFSTAQDFVERFGGLVVGLPVRLLSASLEIVLILGMSAYLVAAGPALYRFALSLLPAHRRDHAAEVLQQMGQTMGGYVRGVVLDGFIVAVIVYVGLRIIGLDYPLVLAIVAFLGELIPVLGPFLAGIPAVGIALFHSWELALIVFLFYFVVQQIESYVILPNIMSKQADIPPLLTLFALLAGGALGGIFWALLALPLSGALRVFVLLVVAPAIRRWTGADADPMGDR